jgi:glutamate synthase (NADPH/NADH) small chain
MESNRQVSKSKQPRIDPVRRHAQLRINDFCEIYGELSPSDAMSEASRCIKCKNAPCALACPLTNDIRGWLTLTAAGQFLEAAALSRTTSNLAEICGRICPQDRLCEGSCVLGIKHEPVAIGPIERFINEYAFRELGGIPVPEMKPLSGKRVAVVGAGPAGLACGEELVKLGHKPTVFEAMPHPGGLLLYGIPSFKLEKQVVERRIDYLRGIGVEFVCNTRIGFDPSLDDLFAQGFEAVFVGTGATAPKRPKIEGMQLKGVFDALPFLIRNNVHPSYLPPGDWVRDDLAGKEVVVLGGGDTAMDSLRTARRMGAASVVCAYRRDEANMPGSRREVKAAKEEGIEFLWLTNPVGFTGNGQGQVTRVRCIRMELGEPDDKGRRSPVPVPDSDFELEADVVIVAFGFDPSPVPQADSRFRFTKWGTYEIDDRKMTTWAGVFAGGDIARGADLLVTANRDGRDAARGIDSYLREKGHQNGNGRGHA